jgi:hypothetical protein
VLREIGNQEVILIVFSYLTHVRPPKKLQVDLAFGVNGGV